MIRQNRVATIRQIHPAQTVITSHNNEILAILCQPQDVDTITLGVWNKHNNEYLRRELVSKSPNSLPAAFSPDRHFFILATVLRIVVMDCASWKW